MRVTTERGDRKKVFTREDATRGARERPNARRGGGGNADSANECVSRTPMNDDDAATTTRRRAMDLSIDEATTTRRRAMERSIDEATHRATRTYYFDRVERRSASGRFGLGRAMRRLDVAFDR